MEPLIGHRQGAIRCHQVHLARQRRQRDQHLRHLHTSPVKTWADMLKTSFTAGGEGAGSDPDSYALMVRNIFGAKLSW